MASDMASLEVAYRVMATPDPKSKHSSLFPAPRPLSAPRKKILGIYKPWFDRADEPVRKLCQAAIDYYRTTLGYEVIDITIPLIHEGQSAHAITILSEAVSNVPDPKFLQPANRVLLAVANNCPTQDFLQAQRIRQVLMSHLAYLFTQNPDLIIVTPTTPNAGWAITGGAKDLKHGITDGDMTTRTMEYVWLANFTGCPAITLPAGYVKPSLGKGDVPIGLMGMGIWGSEEGLIEWGFEGEKYLLDVLKGGRPKPPVWTDVLATDGAVGSTTAAASTTAAVSEKGS
jgi:Asp-tRNA(Asn)/Glu-tRNA(Gln) amidotransferase A subunit family amidase